MIRETLILLLLVPVTSCVTAVPKGAYRPDATSPQHQTLASSLSRAAQAAGEDPTNYKFGLIRDKRINAVSAGNGVFYFTDGLSIQPEITIDAVMAHEVAHEVLGHVGQKRVLSGVITALFAVGGAFAPGAEGLNIAVNPVVVRAFGRSQDFEADRKAIQILGQMGHENPKGLMLEMLAFQWALHGSTRGGLLATHPGIEERVEKIVGKKLTLGELLESSDVPSFDFDRLIRQKLNAGGRRLK